MAAIRRFLLRAWSLFQISKAEQELDREITAHLAVLEDDYRARGMSDREARRAARLALGGVTQAKELHREARAILWLDHLKRDFGTAARSLKRTPTFTMVVVATLALAIGVNVSVAGLVERIVLQPLDAPAANELITVQRVANPKTGRGGGSTSVTWETAGLVRRMSSIEPPALSTSSIERGSQRMLLSIGDGGS